MTKQLRRGLLGGIALLSAGLVTVPAARGLAAEPRPLVFCSGREGEGQVQVYRMDENGQNQKAVTTGPGFCLDPALSPDGKQVAFAYVPSKEEKSSKICVVNLDGTGRKELTAGGGAFAISPCWSPDGKRLLYTVATAPQPGMEPGFKLHLMDADGKNDSELSDGLSSGWSPDGKSILYTQFKPQENISLCLMGADGTNPHELVPARSGLGVFSPDGKKIAYLGDGGGAEHGPDVFVADADGKNPVQLTRTDEIEIGLAWSADGKKIYFSRFPRADGAAKSEIFATDPEGKSSEQLTTNDAIDALAGGFLVFGIIRQ